MVLYLRRARAERISRAQASLLILTTITDEHLSLLKNFLSAVEMSPISREEKRCLRHNLKTSWEDVLDDLLGFAQQTS
jgi:hypothetical protein